MLGSVVGGLVAAAVLAGGPEPLERLGRFPAAIREASGMVASRRHQGIYWVHGDSGNAPELFAVRRDGQLVRRYLVAVPNIDWEDVATDDAGHLYLADTGNNKLALPLRVIHKLVEPDPTVGPPPDRPLPVLASVHYKFAAGRAFDAEGVVVAGDRALIITKRRDNRPAELYRLDLKAGGTVFLPATPERVAELVGCVEPVTGADLTRDGRTLAVVTNNAVRVYRSADQATWTPLGGSTFDAADVEAIAWDGDDLILASEDRSIYLVPVARWRAGIKAKR